MARPRGQDGGTVAEAWRAFALVAVLCIQVRMRQATNGSSGDDSDVKATAATGFPGAPVVL